jgi:hypothetical protein
VEAPANAVKQQDSKLCLEGLNLPGRGRLSEIEACRRPMNATRIHDCRKCAQMAEVHFA